MRPNDSETFAASIAQMPNPQHNVEVEAGAAPEAGRTVNRDIEGFLYAGCQMAIDEERGMAVLNQYLADLALIRAGVPYSELGISERRAASAPRILSFNETGQLSGSETYSGGRAPQPGSIALLQLSGVMRADGGIHHDGIRGLVGQLRAAYADPNVDGVIVETNSPGGEMMAGAMLKSAIEERNKPVVGFGHLAASAAYHSLSAADEIIAAGSMSEFGSIGTMITIDTAALNWYRANYAEFYGQGAPGKNAEHRAAKAGDFTGIQRRVDEMTTKFQDEIKAARPIRSPKETLDGRVWDAAEAKTRGLTDGTGTLTYAVKRTRALMAKYKK